MSTLRSLLQVRWTFSTMNLHTHVHARAIHTHTHTFIYSQLIEWVLMRRVRLLLYISINRWNRRTCTDYIEPQWINVVSIISMHRAHLDSLDSVSTSVQQLSIELIKWNWWTLVKYFKPLHCIQNISVNYFQVRSPTSAVLKLIALFPA